MICGFNTKLLYKFNDNILYSIFIRKSLDKFHFKTFLLYTKYIEHVF